MQLKLQNTIVSRLFLSYLLDVLTESESNQRKPSKYWSAMQLTWLEGNYVVMAFDHATDLTWRQLCGYGLRVESVELGERNKDKMNKIVNRLFIIAYLSTTLIYMYMCICIAMLNRGVATYFWVGDESSAVSTP